MPITDSEKTRRRALLKIHYDVENDHDMNGDALQPHPVHGPAKHS